MLASDMRSGEFLEQLTKCQLLTDELTRRRVLYFRSRVRPWLSGGAGVSQHYRLLSTSWVLQMRYPSRAEDSLGCCLKCMIL